MPAQPAGEEDRERAIAGKAGERSERIVARDPPAKGPHGAWTTGIRGDRWHRQLRGDSRITAPALRSTKSHPARGSTSGTCLVRAAGYRDTARPERTQKNTGRARSNPDPASISCGLAGYGLAGKIPVSPPVSALASSRVSVCVNHKAAFFSVAHLSVQLLGLAVPHPCRCSVAFGHPLHPQRDDADAATSNALVSER